MLLGKCEYLKCKIPGSPPFMTSLGDLTTLLQDQIMTLHSLYIRHRPQGYSYIEVSGVNSLIFTARHRSCGKVMFSVVPVILFTGGSTACWKASSWHSTEMLSR